MEQALSAPASARRLRAPGPLHAPGPARRRSRPCGSPGDHTGGWEASSGSPRRATHSNRKKKAAWVWLGVQWDPGLAALVSGPTQAFLPAFGSLGSSASEPRTPKAQKGRIIQAPGRPRPLPGVGREAPEPARQPPARARILAKRGGGGEPRGKRPPGSESFGRV